MQTLFSTQDGGALRALLQRMEKYARIAERLNLGVLVLLTLAKLFAPKTVRDGIESVHFVMLVASELGIRGYILLIGAHADIVRQFEEGIQSKLREELKALSPDLENVIQTKLSVLNPFFSIVSEKSHRSLFTFSTALVHTTGELIRAIGAGSVDYNDPGFEVFQQDNARHYAEFVYYWIIETILNLNADRISALTMAHYIPATGFYTVFIKRFQKAQRKVHPSVKIRKLYRFRDQADYNRQAFAEGDALEWSRQVPFSELLIEESPQTQILVAYGDDKVESRGGGTIDEIMVIRLSPTAAVDEKSPSPTRIVAVAGKDKTNFQFRSGRIYIEKEKTD